MDSLIVLKVITQNKDRAVKILYARGLKKALIHFWVYQPGYLKKTLKNEISLIQVLIYRNKRKR